MTNPSSRLTKFRLILEEYDFSVHYVKGSENVTADALSRVILDSCDLKDMGAMVTESMNFIGCSRTNVDKSEHMTVITRAQMKVKTAEKRDRLGFSTENRLDHPVVVEILKRPSDSIELRPMSKNDFIRIKNLKNNVSSKTCLYDKNLQIVYINQENRSTNDLGTSLRELDKLCTKNNIPELYILKNSSTTEFLNYLRLYKKQILGTNLKINIVKEAQRVENKELRQLILNDFHTLPTGGHAGVQRMTNNIKKYYF
jgi:hypothetical protein